MKRSMLILAAVATVGIVGAASSVFAGTVVITPSNPLWTNPAGENSLSGSSEITSTAPYDGNGSVEMHGDRTRFLLGNIYSGPSLGLLSNVTSFGFSWMVDPSSVSALDPDLTPALRLEIYDPTTSSRSELIWEGAYNNVYGNMTKGTWYTTDAFTANLWQHTSTGTTLNGGAQVNQDVSEWLSSYSANAEVIGVSVGVGSSAGNGYIAYADDVNFGFSGNSTTYNFEPAAAVPVPASVWSGLALLGGLGLFGAVKRRRQQMF